MSDEKAIEQICKSFQIKGKFKGAKCVTNGHINKTYKVGFELDGKTTNYILQHVNTHVFTDPVSVMKNIINVTSALERKMFSNGKEIERGVLRYLKTENGVCYLFDGQDAFWRCAYYIENSFVYLTAESPETMEETGKAFGEFQTYLADYPVKDLFIAIPHFHNTPRRYEVFEETVKKDPVNRADAVRAEIGEYLALKERATKAYSLQKQGVLPLRVTHNDTKCSNVLFDTETKKYLAVIDLDTVMPGLVAFDFGDAIRAGANTADEDETDLKKVSLDLDKFEAFTRGFLKMVGNSITEAEKDSLALGAFTMTAECGLRFLTDYIDGDHYFSTAYKEHNLVRARCQLALAKDMLCKYEKMQAIVNEYR